MVPSTGHISASVEDAMGRAWGFKGRVKKSLKHAYVCGLLFSASLMSTLYWLINQDINQFFHHFTRMRVIRYIKFDNKK